MPQPKTVAPALNVSLSLDPRPAHITITCKLDAIPEHLEAMDDYDLLAMSTHPIGTGYGAWIEAVLVFRLRRATNAA